MDENPYQSPKAADPPPPPVEPVERPPRTIGQIVFVAVIFLIVLWLMLPAMG